MDSSKGFTLIELMVVMVILAILVALASGSYASSTRRGRDNRRKNDLRNVTTALEAYYNDKGVYPQGNANGEIVGCGTADAQTCSWGGQFKDKNNTLYMVLIPSDPSDSQRYYYTGGNNTYKLYTHLENTKDEGTGVKQDGYSGTNCSKDGSVLCTYGISSGNTTP
jgi:type II secretion system protein G